MQPKTQKQLNDVRDAAAADADRIVAFRNVLIHGYHLIDDDEVWRVIVNSLPVLLREVEALLAVP